MYIRTIVIAFALTALASPAWAEDGVEVYQGTSPRAAVGEMEGLVLVDLYADW